MKPELTMSERANYLKMALALTGITADERGCDMLLRVLDRFEKLGRLFSVHDAVAIQHENRRLFEGQAVADGTENPKPEAYGYCKCGNAQQPPHPCPARPDEITTCKCCDECQTKCAESQR